MTHDGATPKDSPSETNTISVNQPENPVGEWHQKGILRNEAQTMNPIPHPGLWLGVAAIAIFVGAGLYFFNTFQTERGTTTQAPQQIPTLPVQATPQVLPSPTVRDQADPTAGWEIFSDKRPNFEFSFKYPPAWDDPSEHCNTQSTSKGFHLPSNCIKTVVFTDNLPDENSEPGYNVVLTSVTDKVVSGYKAKRKVYSLSGDELRTPYTYELWIYEKDQSIMLFLAWIGFGTDFQTASDFVQTFDSMINTLKLRKM